MAELNCHLTWWRRIEVKHNDATGSDKNPRAILNGGGADPPWDNQPAAGESWSPGRVLLYSYFFQAKNPLFILFLCKNGKHMPQCAVKIIWFNAPIPFPLWNNGPISLKDLIWIWEENCWIFWTPKPPRFRKKGRGGNRDSTIALKNTNKQNAGYEINAENFFNVVHTFLFNFFLFPFRFVHPVRASGNSRLPILFICILVQIVPTMAGMLAAEPPPPHPGPDPLCGCAPREGSRSWAFMTRIERWISGGLVLRPTRCASMRLEVLLPK